ncbi:DUF6207 family protein [Streptomyces flavidovirens]|uniref:DUF6207 family protein n=1 Tax=Streptomyces flavidovirens TaxID=67298 RepID=UPI003427ED30
MQIDAQHIAEPGLVVLDITAADEDTIRTVMDGLQQQPRESTHGPVHVRVTQHISTQRRGHTLGEIRHT